MRSYIFLAFTFFTTLTYGQTKQNIKTFKKSDYPISKYIIKSDTAFLGTVRIEIIQAKNKNNSMIPFYCRSWMTIIKKEKILEQFYYDIEPVGGCSGLFVPKEQPRSDLFIVSKFGDYEGEVIIVDTSGKVTKQPGGSFYISNDKHYLFSPYNSDIAGLTVYDLHTKRILFSKEFEDEYFGDWYFQERQYFSVISENNITNGKLKIATFNFKTNKITITEKPVSYPKKSNKLKVYNADRDCNCGR